MKWIKIGIEYNRKNGNQGITNNILDCKTISKETVEKTIREYSDTWTGIGSFTILNIQTGPFGPDELSKNDEKYFVNKTYHFNRRFKYLQ